MGQNGQRIVFYGSKTEVGKTVTGSADDLTVGQNVMAIGSQNTDGSVSATSIQIRPAGQGSFGGRGPQQ